MSDLGTARGRIEIDTSGVRRAQTEVQSASRMMTQALGALGVSVSAAGFVQLARQAAAFAVEADKVATSYRRQSIAAVNLAGSQGELNDLLKTYGQVTGGAIDSAAALSDVARLLAVGFADSTEELEEFIRAARGISVATGQSQDYVIGQLQLAIANQSTMRLDQLGLGVSEVKQRIDELKASNKNLTTEMAYQQAILEIAGQKFGALADSAEAAATGIELFNRLSKETKLTAGNLLGPGVDALGQLGAAFLFQELSKLQYYIERLTELLGVVKELEQAFDRLRFAMGFRNSIGAGTFDSANLESGGSLGQPAGVGVGRGPRFREDQTAAIVDWARQVEEIERQSARERLDATRQYEQQRTDTIRQYEQTIAREAQDFAISRARAEQDYSISLDRIRRDIASREARQFEDLERTIGDARADAAERASERQIALDERIAETRQATNERIADLESDFNKRRERAQRDHAERLRDAAANLDAVAVREAQRDFRNSRKDAQEDFDERLETERRNEEKRLAELNKAHSRQNADEGRALQKRIDQANEAYQRQLEDARAADEQRLTDMSADFALRQERENEDRAIRLERLREDHAAQLAEQAAQHELRLLQIAEQEQEERNKLDEEFEKELNALGIRTAAYRDKLREYERAAIEAFDRVWAAAMGPAQGPTNMIQPWNGPTFSAPLPSGSIAPSGSRSVTIAPGAVQIYPATGTNAHDIASAVRRELTILLEEFAK